MVAHLRDSIKATETGGLEAQKYFPFFSEFFREWPEVSRPLRF